MEKLIQWLLQFTEQEDMDLRVFPPTEARSEYAVYITKNKKTYAVIIFPYEGTLQ